MTKKSVKSGGRSGKNGVVIGGSVDDATFIKAWQSSNSVGEVVERLGGEISKVKVHTLAVKYRKHEVKLKKMPRGGRKGRTEAKYAPLRQLAEELLSG